MKKVIKLKLLDLPKIDDYKKTFRKLTQKKLKLFGYDLVIFPEDFEHSCYEFLRGGIYKGKFSVRRARRILLVEQICKAEVNCKIIYETQRPKKTIVFISELAEFCFIVLPITHKGQRYFRFLTMIAFGRGVESGFRKILRGGKEINQEELENIFPKEKES